MKIKGVEGMTLAEVESEVARGGKFVTYQYCLSILFITLKRNSSIQFIRAGHSVLIPGLRYSLLSLLLGWWAVPWGPIFTLWALFTNLRGGKNVTNEVMASVNHSA